MLCMLGCYDASRRFSVENLSLSLSLLVHVDGVHGRCCESNSILHKKNTFALKREQEEEKVKHCICKVHLLAL